MEIALNNGEYEAAGGTLRTVTGLEEILQRVVYRLKARRGGFPLLPDVGSRLYTLPRVPEKQRQSAARQFVREALADETDIRIGTVTAKEEAGVMQIAVELRRAEDSALVTVEIGGV